MHAVRYANGTHDRTVGPPPLSSFIRGSLWRFNILETTEVGSNDARYKRYSSLDSDGICRVGERLSGQSIMINREMPVDDRDLISNKDS